MWLGLHEDLIPKVLRAYFRDIQDHVARLVGQIDGMRDMLTTAMQVNLALVANNQNEVVKRLASYPVAVGVTLLGCVGVYRRLRRAAWV
jgi:magnesium transporter